MNKFKRVSAVVLAGTTFVLMPGESHGLGFGRPSSHAILGEPLRVKVPIRFETGEDTDGGCYAAEVLFGEDKVSPDSVSVIVVSSSGSERVLRITTTKLINEPLVTVTVSAGCLGRVSRTYSVFADPPGMTLPNAAEPPLDEPAVRRSSPSGTPQTARLAAAVVPADRPRVVRKRPRPVAPAAVRVQTAPNPVAVATAAPTAPKPTPVAASASTPRRSPVLNAAPKPTHADSGRLVLDPMEAEAARAPDLRMSAATASSPSDQDKSPDVLARRNSAAALWQALSTSTEELMRSREQLQQMEKRLAVLQKDGESARTTVAELEARVRRAEQGGADRFWLIGLGALSLLSLGLATYLWVQLRRRPKVDEAWWQSRSPAPNRAPEADLERTSTEFVRVRPAAERPAPTVDPVPRVATPAPSLAELHQQVPDRAPVTPPATAPVATPVATPVGLVQALAKPLSPVPGTPEPMLAVSVEELIDLEQQAEFFVVLGQDDAAIDLLESHVHAASDATPLPYLKLMEIYQRLGRRVDYERVQSAFNKRFNAQAPAWEADLQHGRALEDYAGLVERLQALWGTPERAMEVLEASLTRLGDSAETFDLPAYRELLLLYAVARDLHERPVGAGVDLVLPESGQAADPAPLMATLPVTPVPEAQPSLSLDLHLDDLDAPPAPNGAIKVEPLDLSDAPPGR